MNKLRETENEVKPNPALQNNALKMQIKVVEPLTFHEILTKVNNAKDTRN